MRNVSNPKNRILLPLFSAGCLLLLVCAGHAAQLKDIRVGEYEDHTRIVFELDAPVEPEKIELRSANQLAVVFGDTTADLIRKIPIERSRHVSDIQFWEKKKQLIALLGLNVESFDHKSFSLTDPPRFALDIFPTNALGGGSGSTAAPPPDSQSETFPTESAASSEPAPQPKTEAVETDTAPKNPEPTAPEAHIPPVSEDRNLLPAAATDNAVRPSGAGPSRLQFYLVIVLVAITIVILALLLLMLLARHRWVEEKSCLPAGEETQSPGKT
jgi:hypothetical protein